MRTDRYQQKRQAILGKSIRVHSLKGGRIVKPPGEVQNAFEWSRDGRIADPG